MIPFMELKSQIENIEPEILKAIERVLYSGWFILGKEGENFEKDFAEYIGTSQAIGVNSGTDAIHIALRSCGIRDNDEVIVPANTCAPTLCGILASGARPVLCDIDPETMLIDPEKLEEACSHYTRAIVPVHLYGHACDMQAIMNLAHDRDILVIEDCAQAHGTRYKGKLCGTFGEAAAFSFYPSKNLGAYGDGGAIVTNNDTIAEQARELRNYGETARYHHSIPGFNSRLDELQAAILRVKLPYLDSWNEMRRKKAQLYRTLLQNVPITLPPEQPHIFSTYHLFVIRTPHRDALQQYLWGKGIQTLLHYPVPIHKQDAFRFLGYKEGDFPHSERACDEVLSLPLYPELSEDTIKKIAATIQEFFE